MRAFIVASVLSQLVATSSNPTFSEAVHSNATTRATTVDRQWTAAKERFVPLHERQLSGAIARRAQFVESVNITAEANPLGGHSVDVVNITFHVIVCLILVFIAAGAYMDAYHPPVFVGHGHPKMWLLGMLSSSYVLLLPGIFSELFSYNTFVAVHIQVYGMPLFFADNLAPEATTESMASLVGLLFSTGGAFGALLVIFYSMVLPVSKLVALVMGEHWRNSTVEADRHAARRCILFVQTISKWACPDMFAYILLMFLLRKLGHPPEVQSKAALDIGFLCFSIFCVCSTVSSLAISLPSRPSVNDTDLGNGRPLPIRPTERPYQGCLRLLALMFILLLIAGMFAPCMGLRLNVDALIKPNGPVPKSFKGLLDSLHLEEKIRADVSLWHCMLSLRDWAFTGETTCIVAFVLLAFFVLGVTAFDVLVLMCIVLDKPSPLLMRVAWVLKHISMLDVFCMGVIVVCLAGAAYKKMGIELELMWGIGLLIAAEICHSALYFAVHDEELSEDDSSVKTVKLSDLEAELALTPLVRATSLRSDSDPLCLGPLVRGFSPSVRSASDADEFSRAHSPRPDGFSRAHSH